MTPEQRAAFAAMRAHRPQWARAAPPTPAARRHFLRLMGASLALAGLGSCSPAGDQSGNADGRAEEVPWVRAPDDARPGTEVPVATQALLDGFGNGVLATTRDGRPVKIEGNPAHPWSRGGTDIFAQACVLGLYDPFRSQSVRRGAEFATWEEFRVETAPAIAAIRARGGEGCAILTGCVTSPSVQARLAALRREMPALRVFAQDGLGRRGMLDGATLAFGRPLQTRWRFDRARVIVSLDGDFLDAGPPQTGVARDWAAARAAAGGPLLALHHAGCAPGLTAARADTAIAVPPSMIETLAGRLLAGQTGGEDPGSRWAAAAHAALAANRGQCIVLAGGHQPASVHAAAAWLNAAYGNEGVFHTEPPDARAEDLNALAEAIDGHRLHSLLILDSNPAYDAPGAPALSAALPNIPLVIHAGAHADETARLATWHLPLSHPLERWGDARSLDGTVGLLQPTIARMYDTRSSDEILSLLFDPAALQGEALLRTYWQASLSDAAFTDALRDGFVAGTALPPVTVTARSPAWPAPPPAVPAGAGLEVAFRPDPCVLDGSVAANPWLQELPKPISKLVWENAIIVSAAQAARTQVQDGDLVRLTLPTGGLTAPCVILPGQPDGAVTLTLGYGRRTPGLLCDGLGYDANPLRPATAPWAGGGTLARVPGHHALARTRLLMGEAQHKLVRVQNEGAPPVGDGHLPVRVVAQDGVGDGRAWGMVIDLDSCIGCNACVVACQSENNIAVVGADEVRQGRDMHWLRIDRDTDGQDTHFMPVPCMQCEDAPCEIGCPVEATLHDHEGLNQMVYNRCVGTRACSGYCPYKVRRFNWFDYSGDTAPSLQLARNPEVTVRARGVMEKCTYCVQRIVAARIDADRGDGTIADGTVRTACQTACPTRAISFGNLADPASDVAKQRGDPRNYALLGELGTRPRTTYLAARRPARG